MLLYLYTVMLLWTELIIMNKPRYQTKMGAQKHVLACEEREKDRDKWLENIGSFDVI